MESISEKLQNTPKLSESSSFEYFQDISKLILNKSIFYIKKSSPVRICEIEFYYNDSKSHNDPFAHKTNEQKNNCTFYFHQYATGTYKTGTYKGLDFTFGNKKKNIYGGILIRSMLTPNGFVCGSCSCVDYILKETASSSINELVEKKLKNKLNIFKDDYFMALKDFSNCIERDLRKLNLLPKNKNVFGIKNSVVEDVMISSRVGLTLKKKDELNDRLKYIAKPYRFLTCSKKVKKGKINLISFLFQKCKKEGLGMSKMEEQILKVIPMRKDSVKKYLKEYEKGAKLSSPKNFVGKKLNTADLLQLHGHMLEK